jgi:hypothetical protein
MDIENINYTRVYIGNRLSVSVHHDSMEGIAKTIRSIGGWMSFAHSPGCEYVDEFFFASIYVSDSMCNINQVVKISKEDYQHNIAFWNDNHVIFKEPMSVTLDGNKFV